VNPYRQAPSRVVRRDPTILVMAVTAVLGWFCLTGGSFGGSSGAGGSEAAAESGTDASEEPPFELAAFLLPRDSDTCAPADAEVDEE
jgi:hypothetical protein